MQLFHIPYEITSENAIRISDQETIQQCKKVFRMKTGDVFFVQQPTEKDTQNNMQNTRHKVEIVIINEKEIIGTSITHQSAPKTNRFVKIAIAMPNKPDKAELIVQKLSEIGVDMICFWPSERSVIKQRNEKKAQRLQIIAKEATEQSRNRNIPTIQFSPTPENLIKQEDQIIIFDTDEKKEEKNTSKDEIHSISTTRWIIGPEWGLSAKDLARFSNFTKTKKQSLGDSILRMETAAIIAARNIKNAWDCM